MKLFIKDLTKGDTVTIERKKFEILEVNNSVEALTLLDLKHIASGEIVEKMFESSIFLNEGKGSFLIKARDLCCN